MHDKYPELGPFGNLYEEWVEAHPNERDPQLEERLTAVYREAWANDVRLDRLYVVYFLPDHFLRHNKGQLSPDLILEGLQSTEPRLAREAAVLVSAFHRRKFDLGPGLRTIYRDLVRRFPECDTFRPHDLYGHEQDDVDDSQQRPFVNVYEDWMADEYPRNPAIAQQLVHAYREAWATGDAIDRAFVLHFLWCNSNPTDPALKAAGMDLVTEALETDDPGLARSAAFTAWSFLKHGAQLGPDTRAILEAHRERFPENATPIWGALRALDELEASDT